MRKQKVNQLRELLNPPTPTVARVGYFKEPCLVAWIGEIRNDSPDRITSSLEGAKLSLEFIGGDNAILYDNELIEPYIKEN